MNYKGSLIVILNVQIRIIDNNLFSHQERLTRLKNYGIADQCKIR
jgi:hypothetical protein